jgi:type I restriction enzyme, S subunit
MNAEQLLQNFDRIAESPGSIAHLRRFILDLAVRGKLVEQDPNDEPASELLKRIQVKKEKLVKEGKIKQGKLLSDVAKDESTFDIPDNWKWARFGNIVEFSAGRTPSRHDRSYWNTGDYPWISIADMKDGEHLTTTKETISQKAKEQIFRAEPSPLGTMLMSFKLTIGKIVRLSIPAHHNEAIISIFPHFAEIDAYLFMSLPQFARGGNTKDAIKGATLNRESISNIILPLPPLAEQHRIVAKVDELMGLCDRLEAAQKDRESQRDRLVASSLHYLNQATAPAEFCVGVASPLENRAKFYFNNLPKLTTRSEHIKQLRQTILNLAVCGKLVPQDPNDEPASELLDRIQIEKKELIAHGRIRREKPLLPLKISNIPFMIPPSWEWVKIGIASLFTEYGTSQQSAHSEYGVSVLKMGDIQDGKVILGGQKKVSETIDDLPGLYLKNLDLLYNRTNSAELVGKTGIYLGDDDKYTFASYLIRIHCSSISSSPFYFNLAMNAPFFRATQITPHLKQQCGQANVNGTILKNMAIPLPPLAEQHRIVAKVDELMGLCDRLEAQIDITETDSRRLLESLLHQVRSSTSSRS